MAEPRESLRDRAAHGMLHALLSATAALIAYLPPKALGLQEDFWTAITAIAVVQTEFAAVRSTARDQFLGAAIGGTIGGAVILTLGAHLATYAAAVMVSIIVCWLIGIATSARLAGTTATIILLVPHPGSPLTLVTTRIGEVGWGVTCGLAVVWVATRIRKRPAPPASLAHPH